MRPLPLVSLYPPRRDYVALHPGPGSRLPIGCGSKLLGFHRRRGLRRRRDRLPGYDATSGATPQKGLGYAEAARAAMPDIDAVTMATPPADIEQAVMYSVPDDWPQATTSPGCEINTEGDYNAVFNDTTFPTPQVERRGTRGRWAPAIRIAASRRSCSACRLRSQHPGWQPRSNPRAIGSVDGLAVGRRRRCTRWMVRSPTIPRPTPAAVSTDCAFPRAQAIAWRSRFGTAISARTSRRPACPPSWSRSRSPIRNTLISGVACATRARRAAWPSRKYEVRYSEQPRSPTVTPPPSSGAFPPWPPVEKMEALDGARVRAGRQRDRGRFRRARPRRRTTGSPFGRSTCATGPGRTRSPR